MINDKDKDRNNKQDKNTSDPRKHPAPGYNEKQPTKKDIQDHPEDQNTG